MACSAASHSNRETSSSITWAVCSLKRRGSAISRPRNGWSSLSRKATGPSRSLMPQWVTIRRASCVALFKSSSAPALYSSKTSFSAARPPSRNSSRGLQFALADVQAVFFGEQLRDAQRTAAGDDRDLVHAVDARHQPGQQGVARLVVGRHRLLLAREHFLAFRAHQHLVAGVFEVGHVDAVLVVPAGPQGGLVDQVADVGAGQADGAGRQPLQVHVDIQRDVAGVDLENGQPALQRGPVDRDVAVETARAAARPDRARRADWWRP